MGVTRVIRKKSSDERTVWEAFKEFQIEKKILGIEEKTIQNYEQSIKRFMTGMKWDDIQLMELEQSDIMKFIANLQEQELSTETINHYLRDLRAFFNWCSHIGYMEKIEVKMVKGQEVFKETYTDEELQLLLEKPRTDKYCEWRSWAVINWILATGNREMTICNIKIGDINIVDKEILIRRAKNKKTQIIPMSTELSFILRQFVREFRSDAKEEDYLFCNVAGEKLTEDALKQSIRDYNYSRGVQRSSVHAFRHTFAKLWIRNNGDVFRLQKMLGHSTLDMTRRYVNLFSSDLQEGFDNYSPLDKMKRKNRLKHLVKRKK